MGIGMIINRPFFKSESIYKNGNDRYIYKSNQWISKLEIMNTEYLYLIEALEKLCFTGNKHLKRGCGITRFPSKYLFRCLSFINIIDILFGLFEIKDKNKKCLY